MGFIEAITSLVESIDHAVEPRHKQRVFEGMVNYAGLTVLHKVIDKIEPNVFVAEAASNLKEINELVYSGKIEALKTRGAARQKPPLSILMDQKKVEREQKQALDEKSRFDNRIDRCIGKPLDKTLLFALRDRVFQHAIRPFAPEPVWRTFSWVHDRLTDSVPELNKQINEQRRK